MTKAISTVDLLNACVEHGEFSVDVATLLRKFMHQWNESAVGSILACRVMSEGRLCEMLGRILELQVVDWIDIQQFDRELVVRLPYDLARQYGMIPVRDDGGHVLVYAIDPTQQDHLNEVATQLAQPLKVMVAPRTELQVAISELYPASAIFGVGCDAR